MGRWTTNGFNAYTLGFYKEQLQQLFVDAFGTDFKLDDTLPQGVLIQRIAELLYNADMDSVEVMSQLNPNTSSGVWLDYIGGLRGIPRKEGSSQVASVQVTSTPSSMPYTIPAGTMFFSGSDGFSTATNQIISSSPQTIVVTYTETGNSSVSVGDTMTCDLTQINDLLITSLADGEPTETDADYRARLSTTYSVANNTMNWVEAKIAESPLVKTTGFGYNDSNATVNYRPPHTSEWMAVPRPGVDEEVFKATVGEIIVNNKVPSSETYGNTTVTVRDLYGDQKQVNFTIPDEVPVEIEITIETPDTTGVLDTSRILSEKQAAVDYINSLNIGKNVSMSRVLSNFVTDTGYNVIGYRIKAVDGDTWTTNADFVIGDREYASLSLANISVGL